MSDDSENNTLEKLMLSVKLERSQEAFQTIFKIFYGRILFYFKNHGVEMQKAIELSQETLLIVWNKAHQFEATKGDLKVWIFTIARNLRFDHFRNNKKDVLSLSSEDIFNLKETSDQSIDDSSPSKAILNHLDILSLEQKEAIEAIFVEGYTHSEYAQLKQIPLGTVKSRVRLALAHLKKSLEET